jgi:hypothetical protein
MVLAGDVHEDLSVKHVEGLVLVGVGVKGSCLALRHVVLEEHERSLGNGGGRFIVRIPRPQKRSGSSAPLDRMIDTAS